MTIVELLVASLILGLGVMGVSALFVASARSATIAEVQADATDIAAGEIEVIRSLPYDQVGIATSASGYQPEVDGRPTVTEPGANLITPEERVERDGDPFLVERSVTWMTPADPGAVYKLVLVRVSWETTAGTRQVELQTGLYEGAGRG